jgi:hypothetical protein
MYFKSSVYQYAIVDYAKDMKKNPSSVKSYMARNPEWALETACTYLDKSAGFSSEYLEMKNMYKKKSP